MFKPKTTISGRLENSSGAQIRTEDLRVMSPTSCHCSTPHRFVLARLSSGRIIARRPIPVKQMFDFVLRLVYKQRQPYLPVIDHLWFRDGDRHRSGGGAWLGDWDDQRITFLDHVLISISPI
jgi:hypothetical protein